jgi:hypothetical protein
MNNPEVCVMSFELQFVDLNSFEEKEVGQFRPQSPLPRERSRNSE